MRLKWQKSGFGEHYTSLSHMDSDLNPNGTFGVGEGDFTEWSKSVISEGLLP